MSDAIISAIVALSTAVGGFAIGKRNASRDAVAIATDTVELLQAQVEALRENKEERDAEVADLRNRVALLENLVTQRAKVDEVHTDVKGVKMVVDRIANKVGV